jgi:nitrilase
MSDQPYKVAVVQAAPVFMQLEPTIDKGIALIEEAARSGARLIAFPECWVPAYRWWAWLSAPVEMPEITTSAENDIRHE